MSTTASGPWQKYAQAATPAAAAPWEKYGGPPADTTPQDFGHGFDKGFQKSLGLVADDPNKLGFGDIAAQMLHNTAKGIQDAYQSGPANAGIASRLIDLPATLLEKGIGAMSSSFEAGVKELQDGISNKDHVKIGSGLGQLLGSMSQILVGADAPDAASNAAKVATDFNPRSVNKLGQLEGAARPANIFEGSINRSVGATKALTGFANPAQALIDEKIASPTTTGRLLEAHAKLGSLGPQLQTALQNSTATVDLPAALQPIIQDARTAIMKSIETPEAKTAALTALQPLEDQAKVLGTAPAAVANEFKGRIGDAVNWEKRPAPLPKPVENAYRQAYGVVKEQVNSGTPGVAELNERVSNLMALKNSLEQQAQPAIKIGTGPEASLAWTHRLEALIGHAATPLIVGAQAVLPPTASGATLGAILASKVKQGQQQQPNTPGQPFHPGAGL